MPKRNSLLTPEDYRRASAFLEKMNKEMLSAEGRLRESKKFGQEEALKFVCELENNYEIEKFNIKHFKWGKSSAPLYDDGERFHAANIFTMLLHYLSYINRTELDNRYSEKLSAYYENQVRRIEKRRDFDLKLRQLDFLSRLVNIYAFSKNKKNFINTYRKYIFKSRELEREKSEKWITNFSINKFYPEKLSEIIYSKSLYLKEKGIELYGNDPKIMESFLDAFLYADDNEPCLIIGETGTGKELVADIMHIFSEREKNKFAAYNCGGITESLFDSEISGVVAGAATGVEPRLGAVLSACQSKNEDSGYFLTKGKIVFKIAGELSEPNKNELREVGGTLFLDEINSVPIGLQAKLLRIIQEKEVRPVGDNKNKKFDAKIVCALNADPVQEISKDNLREDLYYRISRGIVTLPSLRDMKESIIDLVDHKISNMSENLKFIGKISVSEQVKDIFVNYDWPGNMRELENVIYKGLKKIKSMDELVLKVSHIPKLHNSLKFNDKIDYSGLKYQQVEKTYMDYILRKANGNIVKAMTLSGFNSRKSIYTRLEKYGIDIADYRNLKH